MIRIQKYQGRQLLALDRNKLSITVNIIFLYSLWLDDIKYSTEMLVSFAGVQELFLRSGFTCSFLQDTF